MKKCDNCGQTIPAGKRKDSRFCGPTCKAEYWAKQQESKKKGRLLNGLGLKITTDKKEPELHPTSKIEPEIEKEKQQDNEPPLLKFENTLNDIKAESNLSGTEGRPPAMINKEVRVPNPKVKDLNSKVEQVRKEIEKRREEIKYLTAQISYEKSRSGDGIIIAGALSGGVLGASLASQYNNQLRSTRKSKKGIRRPEPPKDFPAWQFVLGALLGAGTGYIIKDQTRNSREKEKRAAIKEYEDRIARLTVQISNLREYEKGFLNLIAKAPQQVKEMQLVFNPAYTQYLLDQSKREEQAEKEAQEKKEKNKSAELNGYDTSLETDKVLLAKNMAEKKIPLLDFTGRWLDFIGKPQTNFFLVIHGMSGEGKTHFTIQFAKYLAENFGKVLYVSGEEGFAPTMQKKIQDIGATVPRLYIGDFRTGEEVLKEIESNQYHFIVFDSVNNMGIDPDLMDTIRQKFRQSGIIAVAQSTKDDKIRGSYQIVHDSDTTVKVNDGIATTTKNRFEEKGRKFNIFQAFKKKGPDKGTSPTEE